MISSASIKAIKAAQRNAGLPDADYRQLLKDAFGVDTCKQLDQGEVCKAVDLIAAHRPARKSGWSWSQIDRVRQYAGWAALDDAALRVLVHQVSGFPHEEATGLTQYHFDTMMGLLEAHVADRVALGHFCWPPKTEPRFWRRRNAKDGTWNTRQRYRILNVLWPRLQPHLPEENRTLKYLAGIAEHACGYRVKEIWGLKAWQANLLIEALKDRLRHAESKTEE